jgi:hopanoid biosynthesis associated protein HpnK
MAEPSIPAPQRLRRLIVNADDFGRSHAINESVIRAHREGVLTSASLMVNEPACAEAVELARQCPDLGVGLHLTLICGKSALPPAQIPGLVGGDGCFSNDPVVTGARYFFNPVLRPQLRAEIRAQFERFRATSLPLDHLNGHLHLHLHPVVFRILVEDAAVLGWSRIRLTRDPLGLNFRLVKGRLAYRVAHAAIHAALSKHARAPLRRLGARHTQRVFGLLQNAQVDERFLLQLLDHLPPGDSELYSHPSLDEFKHEFDALISPRVRARVRDSCIQLIRYQDL